MENPLVTITYKTADGKQICVDVSTTVKELLEQSDRQIRSQRRQDRRHLDFKVRTDDAQASSQLYTNEDTADLYERMERTRRLHDAIAKLTATQRRRVYLYFFAGLSYSEIARIEGVNHRSVIDTIGQALKKLTVLYQK